jgi:DNA mismatch repair protein MutL
VPADEAPLAFLRHATSKIYDPGDLVAISTLGFRGEALPSIASVSHFRLRTRARGESAGTEIRANGGAIASVMEAGGPEGTLVDVADLFYNLPARRKFLKSDAAESAQVSKVVTQLALCYPEVGFTLTSAGRRVLDCPPVQSLADRLYQLYGERADLLEVSRAVGGLSVHGYVAALAEQGPSRGPQNVFVNRRIVKDRTIAHAILDAYSAASNRERSPEVHLFLSLPPDQVDVNVHPTKAEVRFREQSLVHQVVRRALADALGLSGAPELVLRPSDVMGAQPSEQAIPGVLAGGVYTSPWAGAAGATGASGATGAAGAMRPMMALGQFRDTFIIAIDSEGIAIVDQHVAHERVLFERIVEKLTRGTVESQRLLVPLVIELAPAERQSLVERTPALAKFGFEIEVFGGNALNVTAAPAVLPRDAVEAALRALAQDLEGLDHGAPATQALQRMAATTACHAAVKANDRLTLEKMTHILEELAATAYSTVCPHGRPVMLRITRREVEKNFERI